MKRIKIFIISLLFVVAGCHPQHYTDGEQNAFEGRYSPSLPISDMVHDIHEVGEGGTTDRTINDVWTWNRDRQLVTVHYGNGNYDGIASPIYDTYHYNSNGQIDSIVYHSDTEAQRTFKFQYDNGLLQRITYPFGQENQTRATEFRYSDGSHYPYAIALIEPLEDWRRDIYHTDTLVQCWTLQWNDGNLVRATADSMAHYCTGITQIDYQYDNHYNPMQGHFTSNGIFQNEFLTNPSYLSRNNVVQSVYHSTSQATNNWVYQYRSNDGYPLSVTYTVHTAYYSTITITASFHYGEHFMDE